MTQKQLELLLSYPTSTACKAWNKYFSHQCGKQVWTGHWQYFFFFLQVLHFYQKKDTCYKGQREEILSYLTGNVRKKRNVQRGKKRKVSNPCIALSRHTKIPTLMSISWTRKMEQFIQIPFVLGRPCVWINPIKSISRMVFSSVKKGTSYNYLNSKPEVGQYLLKLQRSDETCHGQQHLHIKQFRSAESKIHIYRERETARSWFTGI